VSAWLVGSDGEWEWAVNPGRRSENTPPVVSGGAVISAKNLSPQRGRKSSAGVLFVILIYTPCGTFSQTARGAVPARQSCNGKPRGSNDTTDRGICSTAPCGPVGSAAVPNSATRAANLILFVSHLVRHNHPVLKSLKVSAPYEFCGPWLHILRR